jgi:hypothetical protein
MAAPAPIPVTPAVLTLDEEPNLGRTLEALRWAARVVVVDSGSRDGTERVARSFPNVAWFARPFDSHAAQWEFALRGTGIATDHVLALDADMEVPPPLVEEIRDRFLPGAFAGGEVPFEYRYEGRRLRGSLLAPQLRIFRRDAVRVAQAGHTQAFAVDGPVYRFRAAVIHDDRKPLERWVAAQLRYAELEEGRLADGKAAGLGARLRRTGLAAPFVGGAAWLRAGGPFGGAAAARYALERAAFECLLGIRVINRRLRGEGRP